MRCPACHFALCTGCEHIHSCPDYLTNGQRDLPLPAPPPPEDCPFDPDPPAAPSPPTNAHRYVCDCGASDMHRDHNAEGESVWMCGGCGKIWRAPASKPCHICGDPDCKKD